jgi:Fe-S cluster assembly scaffold protein SufB
MKIKSKITGGAKILNYNRASKLHEFRAGDGVAPEAHNIFFVKPGATASINLEMSGKPSGKFATVFIFGKNSKASVYASTSFTSDSDETRHLMLASGARAHCCFVQNNSMKTITDTATVATLGENSQLKLLNSNIGSKEKRDEFKILQEGRGSRCEHFEVSIAKGKQNFFKNSDHRHIAPGTYSRSIFKYATADFSQVNVDGKVTIEKTAPGADTHLLAKSLLLSEKSVSKVVPQLFVHNADVAAGHGSAMTPLAEEELFYLRSRGIGENESRLLVLQGFLKDLLVKSEMEPQLLRALEVELNSAAEEVFPRD